MMSSNNNNSNSNTNNEYRSSNYGLLQPYIDALSSSSTSIQSSTITTTTNTSSSSSATTQLQRAVINKLLQDSDIFYGYNIIKRHLLLLQQSTSTSCTVIDPKLLNTLDLFSYGTISDYNNNNKNNNTTDSYYISLSDGQLYKLRQLTALSIITDICCQQHTNIVPYQSIYNATRIHNNDVVVVVDTNDNSNNSNETKVENEQQQQCKEQKSILIRETEHILTPLLASKMMHGKLSQQHMAFHIGSGTSSSSSSSNSNSTPSTTTGSSTMDINTSSSSNNHNNSNMVVIQSRDVRSEMILPQLLQSIQQLRQHITNIVSNTTNNINEEEKNNSSSTNINNNNNNNNTILIDPSMAFMPMEVERIQLTTNNTNSTSTTTNTTITTTATTSSANKRSRN